MQLMDFDRKLILPVSIAAVVLVVLAVGGYFYYRGQAQTVPGDPQAQQRLAQQEVRRLVEEVGKLIDLPSGEDPTVATVTDVEKLADQPFFAKAKNGDKVLIYASAKKAILYDPNTKKILEVAPVNIGSPSAQTSGAKVVLRNGTPTVGLTTKVEQELKTSTPALNVIAKENASKDNFDKTLVVVLNETFKDEAANLANLLKSEVGNLPEGESKPKEGDILVILGKDRI